MRNGCLAVLAALALSACAEDYYGPYGGGGIAYYDDFYGPYYDGYWGPDGFFYFRGGHDHHFRRDDGHHFHHSAGEGLHGVHGHPGFHRFPHTSGGARPAHPHGSGHSGSGQPGPRPANPG